MSRTLSQSLSATAAFAGAGLLMLAGFPQSAVADSLPSADCVLTCTITFDTVGGGRSFVVPQGVSELSATVAGAAGAPASFAITNDPTAVGGPGGASIVNLGTSYAGTTLYFGVGAQGQGSTLFDSANELLAVAGGGGGGGYAAYFAWADQILATYPGGAGASPLTAGLTPGDDGAAFGVQAFNGKGNGAPGVGTAPGGFGGASAVAIDPTVPLPAGGSGGALAVNGLTHVGGVGGGGFFGGGGGAVQRDVPAGDVDVDVVAPGGGGSGFLAAGLDASAATPNTGSGYVSFTWSYSPVVSSITPTTAAPGSRIPVSVSGLPPLRPFSVVFDGNVVASGTTDAQGIATASFSIPTGQSAGNFSWELLMGDTVVAASDPVAVSAGTAAGESAVETSRDSLPSTGAELSTAALAAAALLLLVGTSFFVIARRRTNTSR